MIPKDTDTNTAIRSILKTISPQDFRSFGVEYIAYIRPLQEDNQTVFGIFSAEGQRLSTMQSYREAQIAVRMNDLEPVVVH